MEILHSISNLLLFLLCIDCLDFYFIFKLTQLLYIIQCLLIISNIYLLVEKMIFSGIRSDTTDPLICCISLSLHIHEECWWCYALYLFISILLKIHLIWTEYSSITYMLLPWSGFEPRSHGWELITLTTLLPRHTVTTEYGYIVSSLSHVIFLWNSLDDYSCMCI